jgi:hypothetical protein
MRSHLPRAARKELHDNARLLRAWRQWHREKLKQTLAGPGGDVVKTIIDFLDSRLTLQSAPALLKLVREQDWDAVDIDARLELLHQINCASARLRERHKLAPFSDSLPGQRPTLFEVVRVLLDPTSCLEQDPGTQLRSPTERKSHEH